MKPHRLNSIQIWFAVLSSRQLLNASCINFARAAADYRPKLAEWPTCCCLLHKAASWGGDQPENKSPAEIFPTKSASARRVHTCNDTIDTIVGLNTKPRIGEASSLLDPLLAGALIACFYQQLCVTTSLGARHQSTLYSPDTVM